MWARPNDRTTRSAAVSATLAQRVSSIHRGASWDGQAGLSPVSGPPLCHEDGTAASGHHWSLLLPLQVSAKKWQRREGVAMPRLKLLLREDSVTTLPTLPHSASGNTSNLSVFLVSGVVKFSCFGTPLPSCYSWYCWHRPVSIHRAWGWWGGSWQLPPSCFPAPSLLSLGSEALHLLQPQTSQVTNASCF